MPVVDWQTRVGCFLRDDRKGSDMNVRLEYGGGFGAVVKVRAGSSATTQCSAVWCSAGTRHEPADKEERAMSGREVTCCINGHQDHTDTTYG